MLVNNNNILEHARETSIISKISNSDFTITRILYALVNVL